MKSHHFLKLGLVELNFKILTSESGVISFSTRFLHIRPSTISYSSASQKLANLVNITISRFIFLLSDENYFNIKVCSPVWFPNEVIYITLTCQCHVRSVFLWYSKCLWTTKASRPWCKQKARTSKSAHRFYFRHGSNRCSGCVALKLRYKGKILTVLNVRSQWLQGTLGSL